MTFMTTEEKETPVFLSFEVLEKVEIGSKLDHRDYAGKYTYCRVIDKKGTVNSGKQD